MSNRKTVFVAGATGTVGREVVCALHERPGVRVRALVRATSRGRLPEGVERIDGDLGDRAAVARALAGVDAAFYVSPHEADEVDLARNFLATYRRSAVRRLVFVGVHADGRTRIGRAFRRAMYAMMFPHYRPKFALSERFRRAPGEVVVLMPTNFFQNDELVIDRVRDGVYALPMSAAGVNRVDVRDLGDAAARALLDPSVAPGAYPVVGPASLSGAECAAVWAAALGREVRYAGDDDALFASLLDARVTGRKRADFAASFRLLRRFAMPTDPRDLARTESLLGRPPRSYDAYVRDALRTAAGEGAA